MLSREAFNNSCYLGKTCFSSAENKLQCSGWVLSFILKHTRMTKAFFKNLFKISCLPHESAKSVDAFLLLIFLQEQVSSGRRMKSLTKTYQSILHDLFCLYLSLSLGQDWDDVNGGQTLTFQKCSS